MKKTSIISFCVITLVAFAMWVPNVEATDLDIVSFKVAKTAKVMSDVKNITLTVVNQNGGESVAMPATLIGVQNGLQVYTYTRAVWDESGNGRSKFAFPTYMPIEAGTVNWTVVILDDDPDDDTATATTNVRDR
jgi:hypothetical protein